MQFYSLVLKLEAVAAVKWVKDYDKIFDKKSPIQNAWLNSEEKLVEANN